MIRKVKEALAFCKGGCWKVDIGAYGFFRRAGVKVVRFFSTTFKSFGAHRCGLHAAGLTYFTILGFVPVLCLLMVCAKTCGLGDRARNEVNKQFDLFIANIEKGKEEAVAAAVEVTSTEKVEALMNETASAEAAAPQKKDDPAPAEAAESQKKAETAPAEAAAPQKKDDPAPAKAADSQKKAETAPAEAAAPQKKDDPAPAEAADSQKKSEAAPAETASAEAAPAEAAPAEAAPAETAPAETADSSSKLIDVPLRAKDKEEKEALYKAKASKDLALQARKFANEMFDRIDKIDLTTLGWIGFAVLMWTVVSTLGHVETAVNEVWHVRAHRPIWRKFIVYLFVVVILPIFMSLAVSLPILRLVKTALDATLGATSYTRWVGESLVNLIMSRLFGFTITLTFSSLAFAVLLKMMPNRHIRFRSAFYAGVFTAVLVGGWMVLCTTAGIGIAKSGAMYGSFAALPIVLAWIYMSWQIVLLGSCMSYAFECVHRGTPVLPDR